jgi:hypothetical protein
VSANQTNNLNLIQQGADSCVCAHPQPDIRRPGLLGSYSKAHALADHVYTVSLQGRGPCWLGCMARQTSRTQAARTPRSLMASPPTGTRRLLSTTSTLVHSSDPRMSEGRVTVHHIPRLRRLTVHHQCLLDPAGNGTLIFTGNVDANGVTPPPAGCVNITGFSEKKCNESAIIAVPKYPQFPPKRPRCRGGSWILKGAAGPSRPCCASWVLLCW